MTTARAQARPSTLSVLRGVYLEGISSGKVTFAALSRRLATPTAAVRSAIRDEAARGLVRAGAGSVELTPAGRRRLKVVMLGGAFEIIHPGHIHAVTEAKDLGNTLVVVVATDESVERNKGRPPATEQGSRVALVSSLRQVDIAIPGNKGSIFDILTKVRPDVVALGYDQRHNGEEIAREAAKRGLTLTTARLGSPMPGVKTSKILLSM